MCVHLCAYICMYICVFYLAKRCKRVENQGTQVKVLGRVLYISLPYAHSSLFSTHQVTEFTSPIYEPRNEVYTNFY